ncbi:hypothetical protein LINPERPRIM_LOCUS16090 [Linum perenne]
MTVLSWHYRPDGLTTRADVSTSSTFMGMGRLLGLWLLMSVTLPWGVIMIMIMGLPSLATFEAVSSTVHQVMKFPTARGTGVAWGDTPLARKCYRVALKKEAACFSVDTRDDARSQQRRIWRFHCTLVILRK